MKIIIILLSILFAHKSVYAQDKIITTSTNLKYTILTAGSGNKPLITDKVVVHLKGTTADNNVFMDTYKNKTPAEVMPSLLIKGLTQGILLMPLGSKFKFYIPSNLGYGTAGSGAEIKPNSDLIYEVELLKIIPGAPQNTVKTQNPPSDFIQFKGIALKYYKAKDYQQAVTFADKALLLQPKDTLSLNIRGVSKQNLKDIDGALADFTAVINMIGDKAGAIFFRRAIIYETKKEYKLATADYKKMLQLTPDFVDAQSGIDRVAGKELTQMMNIQNEKMTQLKNSQDENRPFMKLIESTTKEIKRIMAEKIDIDKILEASVRRTNFYQFLKKRSKELEAFNDPKWPIFKAEYRRLLLRYGIEEKDLKDF